jgi:prevent-host-death family protein
VGWAPGASACSSFPLLLLDNRTEYDTLLGLWRISMNISSDIKPVTYLKSNTADLLEQINETHRPVIITQNGEPKAVLQDPQSYENMRKALGMLKLISLGEEDIKKGKATSQEKVFKKLESTLPMK